MANKCQLLLKLMTYLCTILSLLLKPTPMWEILAQVWSRVCRSQASREGLYSSEVSQIVFHLQETWTKSEYNLNQISLGKKVDYSVCFIHSPLPFPNCKKIIYSCCPLKIHFTFLLNSKICKKYTNECSNIWSILVTNSTALHLS